eukprot:6147821-Lingulodinium_polyedra.AAC.1
MAALGLSDGPYLQDPFVYLVLSFTGRHDTVLSSPSRGSVHGQSGLVCGPTVGGPDFLFQSQAAVAASSFLGRRG